MQYSYDSNGAIFSYFLVTLFTLLLLPATSTFFAGSGKVQEQVISCICDPCLRKAIFWPSRLAHQKVLSLSLSLITHLRYILSSLSLLDQEIIKWYLEVALIINELDCVCGRRSSSIHPRSGKGDALGSLPNPRS
jgi:hypothetical protein